MLYEGSHEYTRTSTVAARATSLLRSLAHSLDMQSSCLCSARIASLSNSARVCVCVSHASSGRA
jgi:hypothetical protein